jgi:ribosomal protein S17
MPTILQGRVISNNSAKTIMVRICTIVTNHKLKMKYRKFKKIMTHDERTMVSLFTMTVLDHDARVGDWVSIRHSGFNPISKRKRFFLDRIITAVPRAV